MIIIGVLIFEQLGGSWRAYWKSREAMACAFCRRWLSWLGATQVASTSEQHAGIFVFWLLVLLKGLLFCFQFIIATCNNKLKVLEFALFG